MSLLTNNGGLYSTIQDLGRMGYLRDGIPSSGALDFKSHILVNSILGNDVNAATVEMTYVGGNFTVKAPNYIAVVGADMEFSINGVEMPLGKVIKVSEDDNIHFGKAKSGMRAYLGIAGGFQSEVVLNSKSTHEKLHISKHLKKGDVLHSEKTHTPKENVRLKTFKDDKIVRVIRGQQFNYFKNTEIDKFLNQHYMISGNFDRMGFRLDGDALESFRGYDILSEPTLLGSIQVPADGKLIVLMNERQTIGGYPKIATVIKADIPKIAQLQPNEPFQFKLIEIAEAKKLYKDLIEELQNNAYIEAVNLAHHIETKRIKKYLN